jgi:hypothetical protein
MKKFLVLYRAPVSAREQMVNASPEQAKAGMDAWMSWAQRSGGAIVDMGAPLGDPVTIGAGAGQSVGHVGGYGVVQAETPDAAKRLFEGHPHLSMPGASIEVFEHLSMPGM